MSGKEAKAGLDIKLQVGNGYYLDFDRLARLLNASCLDERARISQVELAEAAGLSDRHIENLSSLAQAMGLVRKVTYKPTPLGSLVWQHDGFFDDMGTLWFLHYAIASEPRYVVWNRLVTEAFTSNRFVTRDQIRPLFDDLRLVISEKSLNKHVPKEISTVLDAYMNQRFSKLAYLRSNADGYYALGYREPVPCLVLVASIARFRDRHRPGDTAVSITDLLSAPNSPGVIFQMGEDRMRTALEELRREPGIHLESRADLDQVRLTDNTPDHEWMRRYYESR